MVFELSYVLSDSGKKKNGIFLAVENESMSCLGNIYIIKFCELLYQAGMHVLF